MEVRIIKDSNFEYNKCKKLYEESQPLVNDDASFEELVKNTFFYSFYQDGGLIGCIYLFRKEGKLFLSGFSKRKHYYFNFSAIKKIFEWFTCDIYAQSVQRPAIILLLRIGFKKLQKNLYVYYKNG